MTVERLRQVGREARDSIAAIILVSASIFSAGAAVAGLTSWVSIAAALAAVLSGSQVLLTELVVPLRIRSAENATLRIVSRYSDGWLNGTAFQIAANRWITACHLVHDSPEILLKAATKVVPAHVLYENRDTDLAVLSANAEWTWQASIARYLPESGSRIRLIGWTRPQPDRPALRLSFDYLVHGPGEDNLIALTGPDPQRGFSGAPAIDVRSGRVVGVCNLFFSRRSPDGLPGDPEPVAVVFIRPISEIPVRFRGAGE